MPHALVIGAGPAGSVAAILLARGGIDVTLVEQHPFPRDKVCGECLSALGQDVLDSAGLLADLAPLGVRLTRARLWSPDGQHADVALPRPMLGLSRAVMDTRLLAAAKLAGVRLLQPARVERLDSHPGVVLRDLRDNALHTLAADAVVLADGKGALTNDRPKPSGDMGIKSHFVNVDLPRDTIALAGVPGHYCGLAAIEGDRHNIAFSIPAKKLALVAGDISRAFDDMLARSAPLARMMHNARRTGPWLASPLPRFAVRWPAPPWVWPVGNAAAALEPVGGEGMGLAMASARHVAHAILAGRSRASLAGPFAALWPLRQAACRLGAKILGCDRTAWAMLQAADASPALASAALWAMGKRQH